MEFCQGPISTNLQHISNAALKTVFDIFDFRFQDPKKEEREKHFGSKTVKTAGQPVKPTIKPGTIKSNIQASSNIHIEL